MFPIYSVTTPGGEIGFIFTLQLIFSAFQHIQANLQISVVGLEAWSGDKVPEVAT